MFEDLGADHVATSPPDAVRKGQRDGVLSLRVLLKVATFGEHLRNTLRIHPGAHFVSPRLGQKDVFAFLAGLLAPKASPIDDTSVVDGIDIFKTRISVLFDEGADDRNRFAVFCSFVSTTRCQILTEDLGTGLGRLSLWPGEDAEACCELSSCRNEAKAPCSAPNLAVRIIRDIVSDKSVDLLFQGNLEAVAVRNNAFDEFRTGRAMSGACRIFQRTRECSKVRGIMNILKEAHPCSGISLATEDTNLLSGCQALRTALIASSKISEADFA
ncbi:MAG: hypothetical protein AAFR64_11945 [Pseudomonadota bacterium]